MPVKLATLARDITGTAGLAAITYGAHLIYAPAGYIVGGLIAVAGAVALAALDLKTGA